MSLLKKCIAECIGTFVLVLFGCGTAVALGCAASKPDAAYFMTAAAFGLVIVAMAYSIGNVSGCHINPAVSIGVLCSGKMTVSEFFAYIASQFIGGILGGATLLVFFPASSGLGTNALFENNIWASLLIEIILTFVFVLAIIGVTSKKQYSSVAGLVIGLTLTLIHIFGIHFTGTSVNPARSLGPAIFAGGEAFTNVWVFIVAPLVGGVLAALVYKMIDSCKGNAEEEPEPETAMVPGGKIKTLFPLSEGDRRGLGRKNDHGVLNNDKDEYLELIKKQEDG